MAKSAIDKLMFLLEALDEQDPTPTPDPTPDPPKQGQKAPAQQEVPEEDPAPKEKPKGNDEDDKANKELEELRAKMVQQSHREVELSIRSGLKSNNLTDDQLKDISKFIDYDRLLDDNGEVDTEAVEGLTDALTSISLRTPPKGKAGVDDFTSKATGLAKYLTPKN